MRKQNARLPLPLPPQTADAFDLLSSFVVLRRDDEIGVVADTSFVFGIVGTVWTIRGGD